MNEPLPVHFVDDDDSYLEWLNQQPRGFVLNTYRVPSAGYLMLHRAVCGSIGGKGGGMGHWTDREYSKLCSPRLSALERHARQALGGTLRRCGLCKP